MNQMCFYAYILSKETKIIIRWADITELDKTNSILFPDSIRIVTRDGKEVRKFIYKLIQNQILIFHNFFAALFFNVSPQIRNICFNGTINKFCNETVFLKFFSYKNKLPTVYS